MNKNFLIIAGVLTAFVLVVLGGVFGNVMSQTDGFESSGGSKWSEKVYQALGIKTAEQMRQSLVNRSVDTTSPILTEELSRASVQLEGANTSVAQAFDTVSRPAVQVAPVTAKASAQNSSAAVLAQQARKIAERVAPNARFGVPELVRYSGKVAYEVPSRQGNVYVDANTGAILDNGVALAAQSRAYEDDDEDDDEDDEKKERRAKKSKHKEDDDDDEDDDEDDDRRG